MHLEQEEPLVQDNDLVQIVSKIGTRMVLAIIGLVITTLGSGISLGAYLSTWQGKFDLLTQHVVSIAKDVEEVKQTLTVDLSQRVRANERLLDAGILPQSERRISELERHDMELEKRLTAVEGAHKR